MAERIGAAEGERDLVLFKMDLGIGGALVIDGQVRSGANGSAAEFGHLTIDPRGALCRCGDRRCFETAAGASTALRLAEDLAGRPVSLSDLVQERWPAMPATVA